jgi:uncharacterized membrane protein
LELSRKYQSKISNPKSKIVYMSQHQPHDLFNDRRQFQLERMILFSDAVFAIAITLLVIEIKVPELHEGDGMLAILDKKKFEFIGLLVSFAVIGQFWTTHHRLFGYVENYTGGLLWLNLHLLFWIILVPFASAMNFHHGGIEAVWIFYCFDMFMIGISIYFIWRYILNPKRNLCRIAHDPVMRKMALARSFVIAIIFLSGALISMLPRSLATFMISHMVFILIFPAIMVTKRMYQPKPAKNNPTH